MLHELLFALSGHAGNIFVEYDDRIQVNKNINLIK